MAAGRVVLSVDLSGKSHVPKNNPSCFSAHDGDIGHVYYTIDISMSQIPQAPVSHLGLIFG
jgi:hypothetical protein